MLVLISWSPGQTHSPPSGVPLLVFPSLMLASHLFPRVPMHPSDLSQPPSSDQPQAPSALNLGLSDLANKVTGYPVKSVFQINNEFCLFVCFFGVSVQ